MWKRVRETTSRVHRRVHLQRRPLRGGRRALGPLSEEIEKSDNEQRSQQDQQHTPDLDPPASPFHVAMSA